MPNRKRSRLTRDIAAMRRSVNALSRTVRRLAPAVRQLEKAARAGKGSDPRRSLWLTPKRRATLKLQGSYMGYMRQLKPRQKRRVKAVKEKKGFRAAIVLAKRMAKG